MKTLISSEYGMTISGHVTVLRQWLSEKNTDYIINAMIFKMPQIFDVIANENARYKGNELEIMIKNNVSVKYYVSRGNKATGFMEYYKL